MLCVTKANDDMANSMGYAITTQIDPTGNRCMGVLTKSDLAIPTIVKGMITSEAKSMHVDFKYGWTAVINRNKDEEMAKMSIDEKVHAAQKYFDDEPGYDGVDRKHLGTINLRNNLSSILLKLMNQAFGPILQELLKKQADFSQRFSSLPEPVE